MKLLWRIRDGKVTSGRGQTSSRREREGSLLEGLSQPARSKWKSRFCLAAPRVVASSDAVIPSPRNHLAVRAL